MTMGLTAGTTPCFTMIISSTTGAYETGWHLRSGAIHLCCDPNGNVPLVHCRWFTIILDSMTEDRPVLSMTWPCVLDGKIAAGLDLDVYTRARLGISANAGSFVVEANTTLQLGKVAKTFGRVVFQFSAHVEPGCAYTQWPKCIQWSAK